MHGVLFEGGHRQPLFFSCRWGKGSGFDLVLHAVTFALDEQGFRMVEEPVEDGRKLMT
jgi:hypothetical protein